MPDGAWTPESLLEKLQHSAKFFILDVRNREEFERFRLEGREPLPSINLPYFEMLELGGRDEMVDSVVACVEKELSAQLPRDELILSVCAKGDTSAYVAQGLRRLGYHSVDLAGGMRAWGAYYATRAVTESPALAIYQISRPARGCLSYLVASEGKAIIIDPLRHLQPYLNFLREKNVILEAVIDTHGHADHISGGVALAAQTGCRYWLHPYDAIHPMDMVPATIAYEPLRDAQIFRVGKQQLEVIHIPGHTLGLVALKLGDEYLFTGDSIFIRSIARPDLGGQADKWAPLHARSLQKLAQLADTTLILPGHFSALGEADANGLFAAKLGDLKRHNEGLRRLRQESEPAFVSYLLAILPKLVPEYVDIKRVNAGLLAPDEDAASALELGKNECALSKASAS